jgi:hyperosmotically inducible periplasmic protein
MKMKVARNVIVFGAALLALSAYGIAAPSSESKDPTTNSDGPVAIAGKKAPVGLSDRELTKRVQAALNSDRYVYAEHISVTASDGVVTLQGSVGDEWDLRSAIQISSRVAGVKRVVDQLEIWQFGRGRS